VRRKKYESRYKLPSSGNKQGHPLYWLLVILLAALLVWIWWRAGKTPTAETKPKPAPAVTISATTNTVRRAATPGAAPPAIAPAPAPTAAPERAEGFPRPVRNPLEAQLALIAQGISPGSIDGAIGSQTRAALTAFQRENGLAATGELDSETKTNLLLADTPYRTYTVTSNDLARLQPLAPTWLGKSQQTALDFETILELVAEKCFSHPSLIRRLNPSVNWSNVTAGTSLQVPNAAYPAVPPKAAWVTIHLNSRVLEAYDAQTNLIAHFPCSIARRVEKRPVGLLHVEVVAPNPNYTFDPDVFPESPEAQELKRKLVLPPGPNNPVGVAWIGLDRPGYGMHGTPRPEEVGRTESHGCFRLANWNAEYLLRLVTIGTPVYVVE
jgi:lipoprotein-anchoring transpeptidase ErfK/SrfK